MDIKVKKLLKDYEYQVSFIIERISDEDILRISQLSPMLIDFSPEFIKIKNYKWKLGNKGMINGTKKLVILDTGDGINFSDIYDIECTFESEIDADKYANNILEQLRKELTRLYALGDTVKKEEIYNLDIDEGIKKIYAGAEKLLDANSKEYKDIIDRNRGAWKKLADL